MRFKVKWTSQGIQERFATTVTTSVVLSTRYAYTCTHESVHSLDEHKPALKHSICVQSMVYLCGLVLILKLLFIYLNNRLEVHTRKTKALVRDNLINCCFMTPQADVADKILQNWMTVPKL